MPIASFTGRAGETRIPVSRDAAFGKSAATNGRPGQIRPGNCPLTRTQSVRERRAWSRPSRDALPAASSGQHPAVPCERRSPRTLPKSMGQRSAFPIRAGRVPSRRERRSEMQRRNMAERGDPRGVLKLFALCALRALCALCGFPVSQGLRNAVPSLRCRSG